MPASYMSLFGFLEAQATSSPQRSLLARHQDSRLACGEPGAVAMRVGISTD
jgi:hypothetical protein